MPVDPRTMVAILVGSGVAGLVGYVVIDQIQVEMGITGGLWSVLKLLLAVAPVGFAAIYIFSK